MNARVLVMLGLVLAFLSCGKKKENVVPEVAVTVSPPGASNLSVEQKVGWTVTLTPSDPDKDMTPVQALEVFYSLDESDPLNSASKIAFDLTAGTESGGKMTYASAEKISISSSKTLKYSVVGKFKYEQEKPNNGQTKKTEEELILATEPATEKYEFANSTTSSSTTDSSTSSSSSSSSATCTSTASLVSQTSANSGAVIDNSTNYGAAQGFSSTSAVSIKTISFDLYLNAGWTGPSSITVGIQSNSSSSPDGTWLGNATVDTSSLSTSQQTFTATLSTPVSISANTTYFAVLSCTSCTTTVRFNMRVGGGTNPYSSGQYLTKTNLGTYTGHGNGDDAVFGLQKCAN